MTVFSTRSTNLYRGFKTILNYRSKNRALPIRYAHSFSSSRSVDSKFHEAVQEYIDARKVELQEYQSTNPPDSEEVKSLLTKLSNVKLTDAIPFTAMGLDGLDEVELVLTIESKFGITLSDSDFHSIHSIADAARVLSGSSGYEKNGSK